MRSYNLSIYNDNFTFFAANCENMDVLSYANIDKIKKGKYDLGIILNRNVNDVAFDKITTPLYSTTGQLNYYCLNIFHEPKLKNGSRIHYQFIFIDIDKLYEGNIDCEEIDNMAVLNKEIIEQKITFDEWLITSLMESKNASLIFIVTNVTPYYYLKKDSSNVAINNFIKTIDNFSMHNINYLSTDNDYYNLITMYEHTDKNEYLQKVNVILVGKIGSIENYPITFNQMLGCIAYNHNYFIKEISQRNSGFIIFSANEYQKNIFYDSLDFIYVIKHVVHSLMKLLEPQKEIDMKENQRYLLVLYSKYAKDKNCLQLYKNLYTGKNNLINLLRWNFLEKIYEKLERIDIDDMIPSKNI